VLGQQVSVRAATTLAGRVAAAFGEPVETPLGCLKRLSPSPDRLADAATAELTALGITAKRAETIRALARAVVAGALRREPGPAPDATVARLCQLPGVGEWTASYVAMRALRWPDAFPHGDLGLRKRLAAPSPRRLGEAAEAWRPWRAYAAMHLWHGASS